MRRECCKPHITSASRCCAARPPTCCRRPSGGRRSALGVRRRRWRRRRRRRCWGISGHVRAGARGGSGRRSSSTWRRRDTPGHPPTAVERSREQFLFLGYLALHRRSPGSAVALITPRTSASAQIVAEGRAERAAAAAAVASLLLQPSDSAGGSAEPMQQACPRPPLLAHTGHSVTPEL